MCKLPQTPIAAGKGATQLAASLANCIMKPTHIKPHTTTKRASERISAVQSSLFTQHALHNTYSCSTIPTQRPPHITYSCTTTSTNNAPYNLRTYALLTMCFATTNTTAYSCMLHSHVMFVPVHVLWERAIFTCFYLQSQTSFRLPT